jgi:hypothetical protein
VLKTQGTFPVSHGPYAFLKVLSSPGDGPVYLAALSGATKPWVVKALPLHGQGAVDTGALKAETEKLAGMHCPHLVAVRASPEIERDGGLVMEYLRGKSLAAICERAEEYSVLLPTELGLVVAHDAFSAAEAFHAFEGAGRVHGNITTRTILVGYSGDVKVAGYRIGARAGARVPAGVDAHVTKDLKAVAGILYDLPFEMFPTELTKLVPHLLEDHVAAVEATAAVQAFLHEHVPSARHRRRVAEWLKDVFLDQFDEEARDEARLLASATPLLVPSRVRPVAKRVSVLGGTTAMLALIGGGAVLMSHRRPPPAHSEAMRVEAMATVAQSQALPPVSPPAEAPIPAIPAPAPAPAQVIPSDPNDPGSAAARPSKPPPSDGPDSRPTKRESEGMPAERLLREAEAAFDAGRRIEAINLGIQAVNSGGGVRAHLALGEYYHSVYRYQDALNHYRAAIEIEPGNKLALTGIRLLEKKISPCQ